MRSFGSLQAHRYDTAVVVDRRRDAVEHDREAALGDLATAIDDVGLEHGTHARPVRLERTVPQLLQCAHDAPTATRGDPANTVGHVSVHGDEVAQELVGRDRREHLELVVEAGERRCRPRIQEVGGPLPIVDEGEQRLEVEVGPRRLGAPQPRQLQRESRRVVDGPQRQPQFAQRRDAEAHRRDIRLVQHVTQHEAKRYINFAERMSLTELKREPYLHA